MSKQSLCKWKGYLTTCMVVGLCSFPLAGFSLNQTQTATPLVSNPPASQAAKVAEDDIDIPAFPSVDTNKDPYEKFNRAMFKFNDCLDRAILKPIATLYVKIVPKPLNQGIHNAFNNIATVPTIFNDVLQFNLYQATNDLWRFGVNSTIGVVGFFDVAQKMNLSPYTNDFGLTLAKWGYRNSNYLVLPFFGPNTVRDAIQVPVDYYAFSVYPYINPRSTRYEIWSLGVIDRRAQLLQYQNVMEEAALDQYVFMRNAYLQRRAYQIQQTFHRSYGDQMQALQPQSGI